MNKIMFYIFHFHLLVLQNIDFNNRQLVAQRVIIHQPTLNEQRQSHIAQPPASVTVTFLKDMQYYYWQACVTVLL